MADKKEADWLYNSMQEAKREVATWPSWQRDAMGVTTKNEDAPAPKKTTEKK